MYYTRLPKTVFLGLLLGSILLTGCKVQTGADSYLNSSVNASSTDYRTIAYNDALNVGYPPQTFVNQIQWESGFDPNARGGDGEIGIAQFLPSTAAGLGINPYDLVDSLKGASQLMERYYVTYGYDVHKALAAYNCGGGCMTTASYWTDWEAHIPPSTVSYIKGIVA